MGDGKVQLYNGKVLLSGGKVAVDDDCCCCECTCENCLGEQAACCYLITIADITEGSCGSCSSLNRTFPSYYGVSQSEDNECLWTNRCAPDDRCNCDGITMEVLKDGDDYLVRVILEDTDGASVHVWEKNYGSTRPDCCHFGIPVVAGNGEVIPHKTSSGTCDSTGSTCSVYAYSQQPCPTSCCDDYCADEETPDAFEVTMSGWTSNGVSGCEDGPCACHDGTYVLKWDHSCYWVISPPAGTDARCCALQGGCQMTVRLYKLSDDYILEFHIVGTNAYWKQNYGTTKPSCMTISNVTPTLDTDYLPYQWFGSGFYCGNEQNVTITISAAHGASPSYGGITAGCRECGCDLSVEEWEVTISGFPRPEWYPEVNGTHICELLVTCLWKEEPKPAPHGGAFFSLDDDGTNVTLTARYCGYASEWTWTGTATWDANGSGVCDGTLHTLTGPFGNCTVRAL